MLISKFMTSQTGKIHNTYTYYNAYYISIYIAMKILPNISRSKEVKALKYGQLIEHNVRNVFLQKSWIK